MGTVPVPVGLDIGVRHESSRHGLESLPLDGEEDPVDGHMVPGDAGAGSVAATVHGHAARDVSRWYSITVLLPIYSTQQIKNIVNQ